MILHMIKSFTLIGLLIGALYGYVEHKTMVMIICSILCIILFIYMWCTSDKCEDQDKHSNYQNYDNTGIE